MSVDRSHSKNHHGPNYLDYFIGFFFSVALTCVAFSSIYYEWFTPVSNFFFVLGLALLQMLVQILYFLHLGQSSDSRWNYGMLFFTAVMLVVVIGGSVWTIFNLNRNTMNWSLEDQPPRVMEFR